MNSRNFSITETIAALGVIASLLFVGYEIRQGNAVARNEALSATSTMWSQSAFDLGGNEYISGLMARSKTESWSDFSATEQSAFNNLTLGLIKGREFGFKQLELGFIEEDDLIMPPTGGYWSSKMQHELWPGIREWFSEDFAVFWEQRYGLLD